MRVDKTKCKISTLGNICTLKTGKKDANHADENGCYPFFTCGASPLKANTYSFEGANLIIPGNGDIGRCFYYNGKIEAYQRTYVLHLKENSNIDIKYLYAVFKANWKPFIQNKILGAAMPYIKLGHLNSFPIPIYDLSVQQSIVSELDAIQIMIDGYKAQLEDLDALAQSIFLDMFGDPVSNPKGWELHSIASFGKIVTGNTPSKSVEEYYNSDYIEWIKTDNIQNNDLYPTVASEYLSKEGSLKGRIVEKNSILVCCIAGSLSSIGKCCITNRKVAFNQQINAIECNPQHNHLFSYWLIKCAQKIFMETASTGMKHILSKSVMSSIKLPVPDPSLQQQFAHRIEAIERQKEQIRFQLKDAETLMVERMQYYFS